MPPVNAPDYDHSSKKKDKKKKKKKSKGGDSSHSEEHEIIIHHHEHVEYVHCKSMPTLHAMLILLSVFSVPPHHDRCDSNLTPQINQFGSDNTNIEMHYMPSTSPAMHEHSDVALL